MKVSYNWLQEYFSDPLPSAEELAELLTFHAFEIEEVKEQGGDTIIDVDVLANRSSDCLSHRGIAREIATLLNRPLKDDPLLPPAPNVAEEKPSRKFKILIADADRCPRYACAVLRGLSIGPSPEWLRERLESMGQKSINNVVDATNYVMFNLGEPLHAFDREKMTVQDGMYAIRIRTARKDETIQILGGEERTLTEEDLLIVDGHSDKPLGIAGVKGGTCAEIDEDTTDIILEAAHFNYVSVRKTATRQKLWTDASVRFQNEPSPGLVPYALKAAAELIQQIAGGDIEGYADQYPKPRKIKPVSVSRAVINGILGTTLSESEIKSILDRLGFHHTEEKGAFTVTPPFERLDINIPEDVIEEIGRVYGYRNLKSAELPTVERKPRVNKSMYYAGQVRKRLAERGFSEVYTYTLQNEGDVQIANPLAEDKGCVRRDLRKGLEQSIKLNLQYVDLLGLDAIRIFEIGTVFTNDGERISLAIASVDRKGNPDPAELGAVLEEIGIQGEEKEGIVEVDFSAVVAQLPEPAEYESYAPAGADVRYRPISSYPFVLRDIAVWVPKHITKEDVASVITQSGGELLKNSAHFDTFSKDRWVSYAFRLAFQSNDTTLSDADVNEVMKGITDAVNEREGWQVR